MRVTRKRLPKQGDVLRMTSFVDRSVIAHYVLADPNRGPFITVYRGVASNEFESMEGYEYVLGPVLCGVNPPVRSGDWIKVGHTNPPEEFRLPMFLMMGIGKPPDDPPLWWLFDGKSERPIGHDLHEDLRKLELLEVWSWDELEKRIRTGVNPYDYEHRMKPYADAPHLPHIHE